MARVLLMSSTAKSGSYWTTRLDLKLPGPLISLLTKSSFIPLSHTHPICLGKHYRLMFTCSYWGNRIHKAIINHQKRGTKICHADFSALSSLTFHLGDVSSAISETRQAPDTLLAPVACQGALLQSYHYVIVGHFGVARLGPHQCLMCILVSHVVIPRDQVDQITARLAKRHPGSHA